MQEQSAVFLKVPPHDFDFVIRPNCTFDAKIEEFFRGPIALSAYVEMAKKIFQFFDFYLYLPAQMIENQRVFLAVTARLNWPKSAPVGVVRCRAADVS